ncbi:hypothetical protein D9758_009828 [Tetrapyrgos nigripes]|uniref:Uncharacterized protein n=1 Tax=Tetrapyrgos nigripes TaxID=182062 RepID=A0A8H5GML5_9AGAR|nr:hypothetical protein D9758_009828 [Tetrapyrgos nigripes]
MDYYQRDRKQSYADFMARLNRRRSSDEQGLAFTSSLHDHFNLFADEPVQKDFVLPNPVVPNDGPSPFTSESSSFSDDEPEPNQDDDSDDEPDPAEQFLLGAQEQHVIVDGRSYPKSLLPPGQIPMPYVPSEAPKFTFTDDQHKYDWTLDPSIPPAPVIEVEPESFPFINPFAQPSSVKAIPTPSPPSPTSPISPISPIPVPSFSSSTKRPRRAVSYSPSESEDNSGEHATEDEYRPSPSPPPTHYAKRRRVAVHSNSASTSSATKHRSVPNRTPSNKRSYTSSSDREGSSQAPSRNKQSSNPMIKRLATGDPEAILWLESLDFACSECSWVQISRRMPDFQRHMNTHNRPDKWCCKGVLVRDRDMYPHIPSDAKAYEFGGQWRVGGCLKTFSRRDALTRHLYNVNVGCFGKACKVDEE